MRPRSPALDTPPAPSCRSPAPSTATAIGVVLLLRPPSPPVPAEAAAAAGERQIWPRRQRTIAATSSMAASRWSTSACRPRLPRRRSPLPFSCPAAVAYPSMHPTPRPRPSLASPFASGQNMLEELPPSEDLHESMLLLLQNCHVFVTH